MDDKMIYNSEIHHRRSIRLKGYDYKKPGAYFITICTHLRECCLSTIENDRVRLSKIGSIADKYWRWIPEYFERIELDEFCIMPNHIHGILILVGVRYEGRERPIEPYWESQPGNRFQHIIPGSIGSIIRTYKTAVTKQTRKSGHPGFSWQRNYYERIIRDDLELDRLREYIRRNPERWEEDEENLIPS